MPPESTWHRIHLWGKQNAKWYYVTPPSVWFVGIYILCFIPVPDVPQPEVSWFALDKAAHVFLFAGLALLIVRGWQREKMAPLGLHGFVWLLSTVFGIMIEIQQGVVPHRSFEGADILADTVGAALGLAIWHLMMLRYGKRTRLYPGLLRPDFKNHPSQREKTPEGNSALHD